MALQRGWIVTALSRCWSSGAPGRDGIPAAPHPIIVVESTPCAPTTSAASGTVAHQPQLDALARQSVRFEWASRRRRTLARPRQASSAGFTRNPWPARPWPEAVRPGSSPWPRRLQSTGYSTAAFVDGGSSSEDFGLAQGFASWDSSRGGGLAVIGPKVLECCAAMPGDLPVAGPHL